MDTVESVSIDWRYREYVEPISVHVVDCGDATVLVGGGDENIAEEMVTLARERDVDVVIAEHGHVDHYGAIPALREALGVEVAVPAGDADALRAAGIDPDHLLEAGETYWGIETVAAPGHTPDNMAYQVRDVLLAGDTVVGSDSVFAAEGDWSGPLAVIEAQFNDDDGLARESVADLLSVSFEDVRVSHGSHVTTGGRAAVETLVGDLG